MRILFDEAGFVDFEAPIYLQDDQCKKLIAGLRKIFGNRLATKEVVEQIVNRTRLGSKNEKWSLNELELAANPALTNEEVALRIKREYFAVQSKRGQLLVELRHFAQKKRLVRITRKDIAQYLRESHGTNR